MKTEMLLASYTEHFSRDRASSACMIALHAPSDPGLGSFVLRCRLASFGEKRLVRARGRASASCDTCSHRRILETSLQRGGTFRVQRERSWFYCIAQREFCTTQRISYKKEGTDQHGASENGNEEKNGYQAPRGYRTWWVSPASAAKARARRAREHSRAHARVEPCWRVLLEPRGGDFSFEAHNHTVVPVHLLRVPQHIFEKQPSVVGFPINKAEHMPRYLGADIAQRVFRSDSRGP